MISKPHTIRILVARETCRSSLGTINGARPGLHSSHWISLTASCTLNKASPNSTGDYQNHEESCSSAFAGA